jgi:hypothetical protein
MLTEYVDLIILGSLLSHCRLATATLGLLSVVNSLFLGIFLLGRLFSATTLSLGLSSILSSATSLLGLGVLVGF